MDAYGGAIRANGVPHASDGVSQANRGCTSAEPLRLATKLHGVIQQTSARASSLFDLTVAMTNEINAAARWWIRKDNGSTD